MKKRLILINLLLLNLSACSDNQINDITQSISINEVIDDSYQGDLSEVHLVNSRMEPHPTKQGYVNIVLQLVNNDKVGHIYPSLEVFFQDKHDKTIASKVFTKNQFLPSKYSDTLEPSESKSITLSFGNLPKGATAYQVKVLGD